MSDKVTEEELKSIFTSLLLKLIEADRTIVAELLTIVPSLETHRKKCKIGKTTGVTIAGAGTLVCVGSFIAGLALAPVTFGASVIISGIIGTTATVAGGLTAAGTAIMDGLVSKAYLVQIQDLQSEQLDLANHVLNTLGHLVQYKVNRLIQAGEEEEAAFRNVIRKLNGGNGILRAAVVPKEMEQSESEAQEAEQPSEHEEEPTKEQSLDKSSPSNHSREANKNITVGSLLAAKNVGTMVVTLPHVEAKIMSEIFRSSGTAIGGTVARTVVQSLTVAVGLVFTVVDVAYLVKGWNVSHPLLTEIERIVGVIEQHIVECEALLVRVKQI